MTTLTLFVTTTVSPLAAAPAVATPNHHGYAYSRAYRAHGFNRDGGNYASTNS